MIKSKCFIRDVFGLRSGPCFYGFLMMSKFWNDLTFIVAREHHIFIFIRMKCCLLAQVLSVWQKSEESGLILQLLDQEKMTGIQQGMWVKLCLFFPPPSYFFLFFIIPPPCTPSAFSTIVSPTFSSSISFNVFMILFWLLTF